MSNLLLAHYNPHLPSIVAPYIKDYGLGVILLRGFPEMLHRCRFMLCIDRKPLLGIFST